MTQEMASLSTLTQGRHSQKGAIPPVRSKGPTKESLGGLKAALAGILDSEIEKPIAPPKATTVTQKQPEHRREEQPPKPREVPEDVLTAILRGDD